MSVCMFVCAIAKHQLPGVVEKRWSFFTEGKGGIPLVPKSLKHRFLDRPTVDYVGAKGKALVDN